MTITELFTFREDKITEQELKDTIYNLLDGSQSEWIDDSATGVADEGRRFWCLTRDGDTFTARELTEDEI